MEKSVFFSTEMDKITKKLSEHNDENFQNVWIKLKKPILIKSGKGRI